MGVSFVGLAQLGVSFVGLAQMRVFFCLGSIGGVWLVNSARLLETATWLLCSLL
jgi:hypothetical protein